jgi:hypothetical protein
MHWITMNEMRIVVLVVTALLIAGPSSAETGIYACHNRQGSGKPVYLLKDNIDTNTTAREGRLERDTIAWQGKVYRHLEHLTGQQRDMDCDGVWACYNASAGKESIFFATKTHGQAIVEQVYGGPGTDGLAQYDCSLKDVRP